MKKALAIFLGFLLLLLLLTLLWILLAPGEKTQEVAQAPRKNAVQETDNCNKQGNTRKNYSLTFRNREGQSMVVERVKFRNLNSEKAQVFVVLSYGPRRPVWAEKKSSFRVLQPTRTNPPQFRSISPPNKIPGENRYDQRLRGLEVVPQDVGISVANPEEEPVNPLFLSIRGFAKKPLAFGLLAPVDCPVGQNTNLSETPAETPADKEKSAKKPKQKTKQSKQQKKKKVNNSKKQGKQG